MPKSENAWLSHNKKNPPIVPTTKPTAAKTTYPIFDYDFRVGVFPFVREDLILEI